ncbi:polypeptide N-acetylgalactosaminyltransferase 18-like [Lethenteron reissneri]|uniref:polypeptide N-acetylgalactosaminyltransferase 18-like n=1 Tax=Lethenteron reissneri TaxID=7753 RepID=UPI002AB69A63|nr:polypeptide N-acetylgalactosaminyltransferase 18-like [Lethenteron reissneri]
MKSPVKLRVLWLALFIFGIYNFHWIFSGNTCNNALSTRADHATTKKQRMHEPLAEQLDEIESMLGKLIEDKKKPICSGNSWISRPDTVIFSEWGKELTLREKRKVCAGFLDYGYNIYLSDRLPLDRDIPDYRPQGCSTKQYPSDLPDLTLVLIFYNEGLSILLRALHSAVRNTPAHLLKEVIFVDDKSDLPELQETMTNKVQEFARERTNITIRIIRHKKQLGLSASRVSGIRAASGSVVAIMDGHVEFPVGWAEPILARIKENRRVIVSTIFDQVLYDSFLVNRFESQAQAYDMQLWAVYNSPPPDWIANNDPTAPIRSPAVMGCMAASKSYLEEIGFLDEGMLVYGGENVELGIRAWQCGGRVEILPCSRVAHIARYYKPYAPDLSIHMRRNALRVAEIWMDEYKWMVYMAWGVPIQDSGIDIGDISKRVALRSLLKCKSFKWYLENVFPSFELRHKIVRYGVLTNSKRTDVCLDRGNPEKNKPIVYPCFGYQPQLVVQTSSNFVIVGFKLTNSEQGRTTVGISENGEDLSLLDIDVSADQGRFLLFEDGQVKSQDKTKCMEIVDDITKEHGVDLVLQPCSGQKWTLAYYQKS